MNYFQCQYVSGGGNGNTIVVTCDSAFAGLVVTLTNGTKTYTKTCPSSSPYEIEFYGIEAGTWTASAVESGVTYSSTFLVKNGVALLAHGFNWRTWVSEGGLDPDDYSDLDDVFDDEAAVRRLMLVHDSADYLIACVTEKLNDIDAFCANDTAMKWIGLCDYVCDGLEAITGVAAKFLASNYWERYLKDHVPKMTSYTAPYGNVIYSSAYSSYYPWQAFDRNDSTLGIFSKASNGYIGYKFTTPIMVKKAYIKASTSSGLAWKIQASNDGTNYIDIGDSFTPTASGEEHVFDLSSNNNYYLMYRLTNANTSAPDSGYGVYTLQFYGRAMSVSVPNMTSYTAPYGEVVETSHSNNTEGYKAFNLTAGTWFPGGSDSFGSAYVGYVFPHKVKIEEFLIQPYNSGGTRIPTFKISASNDPSSGYVDIGTFSVTDNSLKCYLLDHEEEYKYYRFYPLSGLSGNITNAGVAYMNFYGKDYSEKEFAENTDFVWLYDHGLDLATLDTIGSIVIGNEQITLSAANDQASKVVDLTDYSLIRAKVGDRMSGTTQIIASTTAVATLNANDAPSANGLNISAVNQELDTGVKMTSAGTCDILELWLE